MAEVLVDRHEATSRVTLNRPEKLNAIDGALMDRLLEVLSELAHDASIRCVLLTGAGRAFSSGGDASARRDRQRSTGGSAAGTAVIEQVRESDQRARILHLLMTMPKPTLAVINGYAVGGGLSLALACDLRIASAEAMLRLGYARVALSGDYGISYLLPMLVGGAKARELLLLDPDLTAEDAHRWGLVNRVVAPQDLEATGRALAEQLASGPTLAYAQMKDNLHAASGSDLLRVVHGEAFNVRLTALSADASEATNAFLEKRNAHFSGS